MKQAIQRRRRSYHWLLAILISPGLLSCQQWVTQTQPAQDPVQAPKTAPTASPEQPQQKQQEPVKTPAPSVTKVASDSISKDNTNIIPAENKQPDPQAKAQHHQQLVDNIPLFVPPETTDLWQRIRNGMHLQHNEHRRRVKVQLDWYARHPDYIDRVAERADPFLYLIVEEVEKRSMPLEIALLPVVESAFQPFAYSHGRAAGIWQFIPGTGRMYGLKQNWWYDGRRDITESTRAALDYLESLHRRLNNDWLLALAAYNSGEGNVMRAMRKNRKRGKPVDFWNLDLPRETEAYVPKLLAISNLISRPLRHNITLSPIANEPKVVEVSVGGQIDLALAADMVGIPLEDIYRLNPAYNRWATDPNGHHRLLIPVEKEQQFTEQLAALPPSQRIQWKRHRIRPGETLSHIARRYATSVRLLQQVNNLNSHSIRQGKHLLIPVAARSLSQYALSQNQRQQSRLQQQKPGKQKIIHTVRSGDTFWDISQLYKVSVRSLAKWNGMAPGDTLKPGRKLVIWSSASAAKAGNIQRIHARLPAATVRKIHYTVRKGDSLARISAKFNVTIRQLRSWNQLPKGRYLQPGQTLKLYVDVTRQT